MNYLEICAMCNINLGLDCKTVGNDGAEDLRAIGDQAGGGVSRAGRAADRPALQHG
jgi:hypothetical protein